MGVISDFIDKKLSEQESKVQKRSLKEVVRSNCAGISFGEINAIDFSSNNYLGLADHPLLKERAREYVEKYGTGSAASRLVSGNLNCYQRIELKLADLRNSEEALILNSGYQANSSILPAFADKDSFIFMDRLCHNSLIEGAKLSGAKVFRFKHNDVPDLRRLIEKHKGKKLFIVTESVFSMDGDMAPLDEIIEVKREFNAFLYVDEAHAVGVMGKNGMGLTCGNSGVDIAMGTFSKALGGYGAFIACSRQAKEFIINFGKGLIYSTALPPAVLGAIEAALELVPAMEEERRHLFSLAFKAREHFKKQGWNTGVSATQIVPIILGDEKKALDMFEKLLKKNIFAACIRPPSVQPKMSRLRFSFSSAHSEVQVDYLIEQMEAISKCFL